MMALIRYFDPSYLHKQEKKATSDEHETTESRQDRLMAKRAEMEVMAAGKSALLLF